MLFVTDEEAGRHGNFFLHMCVSVTDQFASIPRSIVPSILIVLFVHFGGYLIVRLARLSSSKHSTHIHMSFTIDYQTLFSWLYTARYI
jgi:hypothetical protein